jgi:hypothetical protein
MTLDARRRRAAFMLNTRLGPVFGSHEVAREFRKKAFELGCGGPLADVIDLVCQLRQPFICDPATGLVTLVNVDGGNLDKQRNHDQNEVFGGERVVAEERFFGHGESLVNAASAAGTKNTTDGPAP